MTEEQITLDRMQKELREMPSSPRRLGLCQEFVALADREQARAQQISGRYDLAWLMRPQATQPRRCRCARSFFRCRRRRQTPAGTPT